jgi:hypothetical protein
VVAEAMPACTTSGAAAASPRGERAAACTYTHGGRALDLRGRRSARDTRSPSIHAPALLLIDRLSIFTYMAGRIMPDEWVQLSN